MKSYLIISTFLLALSTAWAGQADHVRFLKVPLESVHPALNMATGEEVLTATKVLSQPHHMIDEPLGDVVIVGTTTYDYQANGSLSKMIAVSSDGVTHGSFMYSAASDQAWADRKVKAWCVNPDLSVVDPINVYDVRSGYTTSAVTSANPGNGLAANSSVVAFHTGAPADSWFGVDFQGCTHAFNLLQVGTGMLWPHVAVDGQDHGHLVNYDSATDSNDIWYQGTSDGLSWDAPAVLLTSTSEALGAICVGSKTSPRAAVVFHEKTGFEDIPFDMGEGFIGVQIHHDVLSYIADDGDIYAQFEAGNRLNLTAFGPQSTAPFGDYGSRAYCDAEGIFDQTEDNNFHVAYTGGPQWTDTLHVIWNLDTPDSLTEVYMHWNLGRGQIWHHNVDTGAWSHIWGSNCVLGESDPSWVDAGAWRQRNDHPSFSLDPESGYLYCVWNQYSDADMGPIGPDGSSYPNGEILASCSADNGITWSEPVNLTDTPSNGCVSGECLSESWHSAAEVANGYLHLTYILDRCPGGIPFTPSECDATVNDVIYQRVPVADIPPHAGTPWDAAGRVGLAQTVRWYGWYAEAWCGETAVLDSVKWVDPVHLLNESTFEVPLDHISWHHSLLDQVGPPEAGGITEIGVEVKTPDGYVPLAAWNGILPAWRGTKFNVHFAYAGLTNQDVLIGFHFTDDRPSLYYRLEMENALQGEPEPCTGVIPIPVEDIAQFEETVLQSFTSLAPPSRPAEFALEQNSPNPFNPVTHIRYSLDAGSRVSLSVFNLAGQLVKRQNEGFQGAGWHQLSFDGGELASGVYLYTLEAGGRSQSHKMTLVK